MKIIISNLSRVILTTTNKLKFNNYYKINLKRMSEITQTKEGLPHGTLLGIASTGICGYNSNYQHIIDDNPDKPYDHISYVRDSRGRLHVAGHKWQCVEFARRWWMSELDVKLPGVPRACDIFTTLTKVKCLASEKITYVALRMYSQDESTIRPEVHDAVIWKKTEKAPVGHIAIVSEVTDTYVRVAEQNVENDIMWKGGTYTREFPLERNTETGAWSIKDDEDPILGWVRVDKQSNEAPPVWIPPETNQLEVNGIYDDVVFDALSRFVGSGSPSNFTPEERIKWGPFFARITDYSLGGFLNTHLPETYPLLIAPWKGFGTEEFDREPLIRKFQTFLNMYPEITGVGEDLVVEVNGVWDEATTKALQNMLNKVHTTDEFDSAIEYYRP